MPASAAASRAGIGTALAGEFTPAQIARVTGAVMAVLQSAGSGEVGNDVR
ncbi:MAG: hypothetical protein PGN34_15975 [Methylobacterium frigidaeris]